MDFYEIVYEPYKSNNRHADGKVFPDFQYDDSKDLVCKGGQMFAFWDGDKWNDKVYSLTRMIDNELQSKASEIRAANPGSSIKAMTMKSATTHTMEDFIKYCGNRIQSDIPFNTKIIFSEQELKREDYCTSILYYTPKPGSTENFDTLMDRLYAPEEKTKIMWFMGALLSNSMKDIQKFLFLYGGKGTGKGTVIDIFKQMFAGFQSHINLKKLTSNDSFATAEVQEVPLLIDEDCDLSQISDDTNLLKLVAHETIIRNQKYTKPYEVIFPGLLITASNQRFKVRNVDSGITRRAIVVEPSTLTFDGKTYRRLKSKIKYEIPHIAYEAMAIFEKLGPTYYDDYMDMQMLKAGDLIYEFVSDNYEELGDLVSLRRASELYKGFLDELGFDTKGHKKKIANELQRYYRKYYKQHKINGENVKNVFSGFKRELIFNDVQEHKVSLDGNWIELKSGIESAFNLYSADDPAQYAVIRDGSEVPAKNWVYCNTTLKELDTSKLHYVNLPKNHIVIDFDLKKDGKKNLELNLEAANKFPATYVETSKSGNGLHLHYIYDGDVDQLSRVYEGNIEVKIFNGDAALRRQLTVCNDLEIAHISTGLPFREKKPVIKDNKNFIYTDTNIHTIVRRCLHKEYGNGSTTENMHFIKHVTDQAEAQGVKFNINDLKKDINDFAAAATNQFSHCINVAEQITYSTVEPDDEYIEKTIQQTSGFYNDEDLYFFDIEVFPNMWMVCYKKYGDEKCKVLFNPTSNEIEALLQKPLVGFNNRGYDNHILYAGYMGYTPYQIYCVSKDIIENHEATFVGAYELSYTDILDYSSVRQSLKKWEIEMGIKHDEFEYNFDEPLDESLWDRCAEYCCNDVDATEALFKYIYPDYLARKILATLSGLSMNTPTRKHAEMILFEGDKHASDKFNYYNLDREFPGYKFEPYGIDISEFRFPTKAEMVVERKPGGRIVRDILEDDPDGKMRKRWFGTKTKSIYRGDPASEGGYVYSEPGYYTNVALLDIASLHPSTIIATNYFGPYTKNFADIVHTRIHVKHGEFEQAKKLFGGKLSPFLQNEEDAEALSHALKIVINRIYGFTVAKFSNPFQTDLNVDNFVAKRGALFMIELKYAVQAKGFTVAHIKTDSIKIPNATPEIIQFVMDFGKKYGYTFELEHMYAKMLLINKSEYIAKFDKPDIKKGKEIWWEAKGDTFKNPYVFKTLFSGEELELKDFLETKEVKDPARIYLGDSFVGKNASVYAATDGYDLWRIAKDKKDAVTGTKGRKWKLATDLTSLSDVDMSYYIQARDDVIDAMNLVGPSGNIVTQTGIFDTKLTYF